MLAIKRLAAATVSSEYVLRFRSAYALKKQFQVLLKERF